MATSIDQKAYLQKYLGGPSSEKKKKKKKAAKGKGFKIIDDDIDLSKLRPLEGDELDILDSGEDAPQVAGIIDERPEDVRKQEQFKTSSKWRVINHDDGFNSKLQIEEIKNDIKETEKENELVFGKMYSDSEDEKKNDSDLSPPKKLTKTKENTSISKKHNTDSDFSPPRKRDRESSPKRRTERKNSDVSPPRKHDSKPKERVRKPSRWGEADDSRDQSPDYSKGSNSKSRSSNRDLSPPRKSQKVKNYDSDVSPRRKSKKDSSKRNRSPDSDVSPPRKRKQSPAQAKHNFRNNPRHEKSRKHRQSPDSDLSPPRKNNKRQKSTSPPRKSRKHSPEMNRKRIHNSDSDLSPPRRDKERNTSEKNSRGYKRGSESPPPSNKKMARTLDGKKAGLQDARQLRQENQNFRQKEDEIFNKMTDDISGRNAQVVSRKGKRETSEDRTKQREKAERQKELDEKYKKWSKGLKQIEAQESRMQDFMHEACKPLARHKDDRDLETSLKRIERAGDPMLQYMREKKRERGEMAPERPMYKGNFPPNRFNLRPGYRWDGVDRSNGYEKKFFDQQSKKKAQEEEAYKWSTEDL